MISLVRFDRTMFAEANVFYQAMRHSRTFTHFRHTRPSDMIVEGWVVWLLCDGVRCVAWGQMQVFSWPKSHVARIGFAVLPEEQGNGYGSKMLDHLIASSTDKDKLTASVFLDNEASLGMFERRGFVREGVFRDEERWEQDQPRDVVSLAKFRKG